MAVEGGKGDVSAVNDFNRMKYYGDGGIRIGDLGGFQGGASSGSDDKGDEEEIGAFSDGEDIMVELHGSDVFFDGICSNGEGQHQQDDEANDDDEGFRELERHIDATLLIKVDELGDHFDGGTVEDFSSDAAKSDDQLISCVRALAQSVPGSQIEQPAESLIPESRSYLKRKLDRKDLKPSSCQDDVPVSKKQKNFSGAVGEEELNIEEGWNNVAQLSGLPASSNYEEFEDFLISSSKDSPLEMLSKFKMLASQGLGKEHSFMSSVVGFFTNFRNRNLYQEKYDEVKMIQLPADFSIPERQAAAYPGEEIKDSYWTDMIIQNGCPEKPLPAEEEAMWSHQVPKFHPHDLVEAECPKMSLRKRSFSSSSCYNFTMTEEHSPAELILTFDDLRSIPSKTRLNNIFRRFGTLREADTVVYQEFSRARVVFKRKSDAEVAFSSARAFNFIGPSVLSYELRSPVFSYNAMPSVKVEENTGVEMLDMQDTEFDLTRELEMDLEDPSMQQLQSEQMEEGVTNATMQTQASEETDDVDIISL